MFLARILRFRYRQDRRSCEEEKGCCEKVQDWASAAESQWSTEEEVLMHACEIFEMRGVPCPFERFEDEEDEDDDDKDKTPIKVGIPARKRVKGGQKTAENVTDVFRDTVPFVVAGDRLKQLQGAAERVPEVRELIPRLNRDLGDLPNLGPAGMFASAGALALGEALRASRGRGSPLQLQRQVAGAFGAQQPGTSGGRGGGFNVNAREALQLLLKGQRRKLSPGFGQFSLAGLGDTI